MGKSFEEAMRNCAFVVRLNARKIATAVLYCNHSNDDCVERYCPAIGNTPRRLSRHSYYENGVPGDSQCPTCGSVVMSDEITLPSTFQEYTVGFICGAAGTTVICLMALFAGGVIRI